MIQTIRNAWKIPELRKKLMFTLVMMLIFRFGSVIPVPFVNSQAMAATSTKGTGMALHTR